MNELRERRDMFKICKVNGLGSVIINIRALCPDTVIMNIKVNFVFGDLCNIGCLQMGLHTRINEPTSVSPSFNLNFR